MKIIIAKSAGFCYGVKKAVELAEKASKSYNKPIYTVGPLMHNKHEVKRLSGLGINAISTINNIKGGTVIIRTHGLPKDIMNRLSRKNADVIDATCPFVKRVQNLVEKLSKDGYNILVIGEKNHPEVVALVSYSTKPVVVVNSPAGIKNLKLKEPVAVVSQTTQSSEKFDKLNALIHKKYRSLKVYDTICNASNERQDETKKLAKKVNVMLVLGGKNSGNTTRLKDICLEHVKTFHIESSKDLKKDWFKKIDTIGITAGASTPQWLIGGVVSSLRNFTQKGN
ncbi:MAG: 4-hydroxy-3-methylbut-2-enyl diphosphate reductase [Elusimicrobia bacterium RIFOXYA2_FULL_40_6]|nr:MAG: 4-hydroxy-3-methylbut-2-enyl diphosphate reductase [Elusimicrobia bacterium RIFOXYA2_FULL_40_6]